MSISTCQRVLRRSLDEVSLAKALRSLLPRRNGYCAVNYPGLLAELRLFGVLSLQQFRRLILRHRREAIRIDREPLDAMNTRMYREELGEKQYSFLERRQIFFGWEGLVRVILELEFGDRYRAFAERRDHEVEAGHAPVQRTVGVRVHCAPDSQRRWASTRNFTRSRRRRACSYQSGCSH